MLTKEQKDLVKALREEDKGYKEIADILGCTKQEVREYCRKGGLSGFRSSDYHGSKETREKGFKDLFETHYPDYEYHSGFTNRDSMFKCKCKKCGHVQERMAYYVQPSKVDYNIVCDGCNEIKRLRQSILDLLVREHNRMVREQNKSIRENERIEKKERLKGFVCDECGTSFNAVNVNQKYCSVECSNKRDNRIKDINRRTRLKENGGVDWSISLTKLIKRDKNRCHICGSKCNKNDYTMDELNNFIVGADYPSIDHVIPVSKGGTHTWDNVKLAHHYCNSIKSNNEVYEDREERLKMSI
ncbi:HNH endonuclease [Gudongella sp. SC589]|uniref:HNH endonuclease n=1 Tax=Gudongella sp. SC589 TaxID=3385990 RepID=UPI003904C055